MDEGDETRHVDHLFGADTSASFLGTHRSQRCTVLNRADQRGGEAARRLITWADALLENFRTGALDRLGLGYEAASAANLWLELCSVTSFGPSGPASQKPGLDLIAQAMGKIRRGAAPRRPTHLPYRSQY